MKNFISNIKNQSTTLAQMSDEELNLKIEKVTRTVDENGLDNSIVEWFALVQEVSFREIGLRHFDTQLLAGLLLHEGKIVEMKTGEGKTLASTLPVSLNGLSKKGVHVVTVNEYLAERDQKLMGKVYRRLGLSVGLVKSKQNNFQRRKNYEADITYVTNSELVFDFLRDSSAYNRKEIVQRPFNYCVIDEIDSILIDEARTPLILSIPQDDTNINKLYLAKAVISNLQSDVHFQVDEKRKDINLTEEGYKEIKERLGKRTLYDSDDPWILEILNALKAQHIFKLNKDYIILNNKIVIVDEFTGRVMEDRRWSMGIHEAVEIKEEVPIGGGTKTKSAITYQNFFTLYPKLAGMTGTGKTTEKEFQDIYNLEVVVLPTAKPMVRNDAADLVYQSELSKWKAVLEQTQECYQKEQPILIGTASVEKSEFLSDLFKVSKIPHQVLNAKPENLVRENEIIAEAGQKRAVTIATNMAGRGTDIILGGNPIFRTKQKLTDILLTKKIEGVSQNILKFSEKTIRDYEEKLESDLTTDIKNLPYSLDKVSTIESLKVLYTTLYDEIYIDWKIENKDVINLGGLFVLGTERHETRRIDNQLRGRAGRQGDPGTSQFYVSLEDDLIKIFGGDSIKRWVEYLVDDKDSPLESGLLTNSLENAQKKVELYNYEMRKNIFQYDDILNTQRKQLFKARNEILCDDVYQNLFLRYSEAFFDEQILKSLKTLKEDSIQFLYKFEKWFDSYSTILNKKEDLQDEQNFYKEIWISNDLRFSQSNFYQIGFLKNTRSTIILSVIDFYWTEHIERMNYIRETINWRSYGQQNPLIEYNTEAFKSFKLMFEEIQRCMLYYFLNNAINY
jgi:preprotein translocase subunit SecA|tara:strand:- start:3710 stop:6247 length:2538 start_codon:yes stop_codon:yes gene_type:complete